MEKVIVFGSLSMDMSVRCRAIPHRGETAIGGAFMKTPGGMGGNQAVMCSRMGADTFMVGKVGDDHSGRELMASLARHGVVCSNVSVSEEEHTGIGLVLRGEGDNRTVIDPGANARTTYQEVRAAIHGLAGNGNIFLCQLDCDLEATMQSILCAKRNGLYTILNATPARSIPTDVYQALDVLCINEGESEFLSGIPLLDEASRERALRFFERQGVGHTIITLGRRGSITLIDDEVVNVPCFTVETVDTTGAGDAYVGELASHICFGGDIKESMVYASAAAALCVTKVGTQAAMPTFREVRDFMAAYRKGAAGFASARAAKGTPDDSGDGAAAGR